VTGVSVRSEHSHTGPIPAAASSGSSQSNYLRVQPVEVDIPAALDGAGYQNIGELTVRNLLAAATMCLGLATPALASVELSPEQLDSVTAGITLILNFVPSAAASIPAFASQLTDQGWQVTTSGTTLTAVFGGVQAGTETLGLATPTITVNSFMPVE
jgi:hypothetical protein